ncbi:ParB/RepB/Spo0J family partition protein [Patescibacteria group bacterium]|nr:ParB/RepB/Spo0J family partition protein [Patescibacteria group bacterium]MBU2218971.1 ParB/RepB/Spo0J family partition protein [Patescibacteria group bacterium]MBU2263525.1 ParB/RepB/Spo0J family partition protein [Patescibacteria group bacterium]
MNNPQREQKIFWIEVDKIKPNPMQPRSNFDEARLLDLAESIRQYGVLQPLVVVRKEIDLETGTRVEYELIAGERRLRAAKIAGLMQVPVIIRDDEGDKIKLELAIIENLQREDLNPLERAVAFKRLAHDFKLKHHEIGGRIGKSRVFVTNTLRLLNLPEEIQRGLRGGIVSEGHMRPLLMLSDRKEEQTTLYYEILEKKLTVRQSEEISRRIAQDRARKKDNLPDPETKLLEEKISESLGTKVMLERQGEKRKLQIEFFSDEELQAFLDKIMREREKGPELELEFPQETQQLESDDDLIEKFSI